MAATPIEPVSKIAGMAAILPVPVSVNLEFLTAMPALQLIVRLALHLIEIPGPVLISALVATIFAWLLLGYLLNNPATINTGRRLPGIFHGKA